MLETFFNWEYNWQVFPDLLSTGLWDTLILALTSAVIGAVLGLGLALLGLSRTRWLRWPARVYTDVFRGLPAIVTILLVGQGLAVPLRPIIGTDPYPLGILALSLVAAAYTGNLSPLTAAALCYLVITIPLTHLVNYIDRRLREPETRGTPLRRVLGLAHARTGG